jgi:hypothetical protein
MKLSTEKRTIKAMVGIYCKKHHGFKSLCSECNELLDYAYKRIEHCKFGDKKPACNSCPVHCYAPLKREKIREVMRFSGKFMPLRHPYLSIIHLLKAKRRQPNNRFCNIDRPGVGYAP